MQIIKPQIKKKQDKYNLKPDLKKFREELLQMIGDRSEVFCSIDRHHMISGIRNKLAAYQTFLDAYPRTNSMTCLIQYLIPLDNTKDDKDATDI